MTKKQPSFISRWMITRLEVAVIAGIVVATLGGLYFSIQDVLQLDRAINLNVTQTLTVSQGIVNLQREVLLTHDEIVHLLGNLDNPPKPITRFDFIKIQVNNLTLEVDSPDTKSVFPAESLALAQDIATQFATFEQTFMDWQKATILEQQQTDLRELADQSETLETTIKQLIDRQSTAQREAITQTKDSPLSRQRMSIGVGC